MPGEGDKLRNLGWLCLFSVSVGGFPRSTHTYLRMMGVGAMPLMHTLDDSQADAELLPSQEQLFLALA